MQAVQSMRVIEVSGVKRSAVERWPGWWLQSVQRAYATVVCELRHGQWAETVSYSRQGAWRCTKPGCRAELRPAGGAHTVADIARA